MILDPGEWPDPKLTCRLGAAFWQHRDRREAPEWAWRRCRSLGADSRRTCVCAARATQTRDGTRRPVGRDAARGSRQCVPRSSRLRPGQISGPGPSNLSPASSLPSMSHAEPTIVRIVLAVAHMIEPRSTTTLARLPSTLKSSERTCAVWPGGRPRYRPPRRRQGEDQDGGTADAAAHGDLLTDGRQES